MIEERMVSKQTMATLIREMEQALADADEAYPPLITSLKGLDPFLNLKQGVSLHRPEGKEALARFREKAKIYRTHVERFIAAYNDLSTDLQSVLAGRGAQDVLIQELARQGNVLLQEIGIRQEAAKIFIELAAVLERIAVQEKASPAQQKKIENLVFRLQVLG